uniref:Serine/threonine-protein kinase Pkn1 n=1 Tax=uncultured bacterium Contig1522a TaxID=1393448 RepID=W0FMB9_9BACT|nr:serine/threonine-protein kinase Pkn1 [uncultured bacterium Contig1522a]
MQGNRMKIAKKAVDVLMTVLLLCLMAYPVTGETLHEWCGIGMTVLLIVHHILNRKWTAALFKGKYGAYRTVSTAVNALLFVSIALTAVCGMAMSSKAVPFLYGILPVSFARRFHLSMSYWSFVLMGFHLGLHVPAMTAGWKLNKTVKTILAAIFALIAGFGFMLFLKNGIPGYLFFRTPFAFFDYGKSAPAVFAENLAMLIAFAFLGACCASLAKGNIKDGKLVAVILILASLFVGTALLLFDGGKREAAPSWENSDSPITGTAADKAEQTSPQTTSPESDGFVLLPGGTFRMGSPETENWRIADETPHTVTVSPFWIDPCETTGEEYARLMGEDPRSFAGENLPAEQVSWLDAILFANAKSRDTGLTPVYTVSENGVTWNRSANGYRLPTEAEWEYACRAGTETPFNTEKSMDADEANFYGHYPYEIEENYFDDSVLEARPGVYRQTTLPVGSFTPNGWGLYDMHGNVNEWCWDYYGEYDPGDAEDPAGSEDGTRHVYRGGGWNDFGKNMRSAYRAAGQSDLKAANLGIRLVRNAEGGIAGTVTAAETVRSIKTGGRVLIAYFSWSGNTRGIAEEIGRQTEADLYEITPVHPYSDSYNTVLMEAQEDQHKNARPELADPPASIEDYDVILLGYPNWWASIPMPVASFLELYDFSGKTIVPFCSHGGGRFGQSLTAIAKLAPDAVIGEGLSVHYSGGASLPDDVAAWLDLNGIERK